MGTRQYNASLYRLLCTVPEFIPDFFVMQEADENGSDGLDIDEFRTAFGQILGKGKNDQQVLQIIAVVVHDIRFAIGMSNVVVGFGHLTSKRCYQHI